VYQSVISGTKPVGSALGWSYSSFSA
jgi:hypothetical protein